MLNYLIQIIIFMIHQTAMQYNIQINILSTFINLNYLLCEHGTILLKNKDLIAHNELSSLVYSSIIICLMIDERGGYSRLSKIYNLVAIM